MLCDLHYSMASLAVAAVDKRSFEDALLSTLDKSKKDYFHSVCQ